MSKTVSLGFVDTKPGSSATFSIARPALNFKADFAIVNESENKTILSNLTTPVDQRETIRWEITDVSNIYSGTDIDPSVFASSKKGISLLVQLNDVARVTDDTDPSFQIDLPISVHTVVKVPKSQYVTAELVQQAVFRLLSAFYDTNSEATSRINALIRGSMTPSDL